VFVVLLLSPQFFAELSGVKDLICAELSGVEIIGTNLKDMLHVCKQKYTLSDVRQKM
jgi:hypothetical protein